MKEKENNVKRIPHFKEVKEAAEFWSTHSFEEYAQDTREGEIQFVRPPKKTVTIRLDPEDVLMVEKLARHRGLSHAALVRMWIKEMLRKEAP